MLDTVAGNGVERNEHDTRDECQRKGRVKRVAHRPRGGTVKKCCDVLKVITVLTLLILTVGCRLDGEAMEEGVDKTPPQHNMHDPPDNSTCMDRSAGKQKVLHQNAK